jgi:hypothetical protein
LHFNNSSNASFFSQLNADKARFKSDLAQAKLIQLDQQLLRFKEWVLKDAVNVLNAELGRVFHEAEARVANEEQNIRDTRAALVAARKQIRTAVANAKDLGAFRTCQLGPLHNQLLVLEEIATKYECAMSRPLDFEGLDLSFRF